MAIRLSIALISMLLPSMAAAISLPENATLVHEDTEAATSFAVPTGPWNIDRGMSAEDTAGDVARQVWRIDADRLTTLQLMAPLRQQLAEDGYTIGFECRTNSCGGFDFRFGLDLTPPPAMLVDLGDYRYLLAKKAGETVVLFVSKTLGAGYVEVIRIGRLNDEPVADSEAAPVVAAEQDPVADDMASAFMTTGHVELWDLTFETGSSELSGDTYQSLADLASYLESNPTVRIALVGHTDSQGSLNANIDVSKARARAVLERLAGTYGISRDRMDAQGMGYLAPRSSNLTQEGRDANRRVEAIALSN